MINELNDYMLDEKNYRYVSWRGEVIAQKKILKVLQEIDATNDINLILTSEKVIYCEHLRMRRSKPLQTKLFKRGVKYALLTQPLFHPPCNPPYILKIQQIMSKLKVLIFSLSGILSINNFHLKYYSNSKPMESSLSETINNLRATEILVNIMQHNPNEYKIIAKGFTQSKNISAGLPLDEARQYFRAQKTRFINMSKVDLSDEKKDIIELRKNNLRHAGEIYSAMQAGILGTPKNQTPKGAIYG